jgi:hypothetical protein
MGLFAIRIEHPAGIQGVSETRVIAERSGERNQAGKSPYAR